jgi:hypothetical protein
MAKAGRTIGRVLLTFFMTDFSLTDVVRFALSVGTGAAEPAWESEWPRT